MTNTTVNNATVLNIPQVPAGSAITNLVVKSLSKAVEFYHNVLDMDIMQASSRCAVITNGAMTLCLVKQDQAGDIFGFNIPAIEGGYRAKDVMATLVCKDVWAVWSAAMAFGATSIQMPVTSANGMTSAVLQDPNNYTIVLQSRI